MFSFSVSCVCLQHRVVVPKAGKVSDLCFALSEMTNVTPTQVSVCVRCGAKA